MGLHGNIQLGRHGGKRRLMAPGGRLMAENDRPWGISDGFKTSGITGVFLFNSLNLD
jgi:hypothetical protein